MQASASPARISRKSTLKQKAVLILSLRAQGCTTEEIAKELGIKPASVNQTIYRAGKEGWIKRDGLVDPRDQIEYSLSQRIVRNLDEFLDSDDDSVRKEVTLEVAKGTLFKKFGEQHASAVPVTMLSIRVEMPTGGIGEIREGTTGGAPRFIEGQVVGAAETPVDPT